MGIRQILRWILGTAYLVAGVLHLTNPQPFVAIVPSALPEPDLIVFWTGVAEIAGAFGMLQPMSRRLRKAAGAGLALYALCVWPANINHFAMDMARVDRGLGVGYHVPRMFLQPILIWMALWVGDVTDWPRRRKPMQ